MRAVGAKRPRGLGVSTDQASGPWAGRVPKPAMEADSFVDYGSGFLRKSCDSCVSSKRRCDGQDPCTRCLRRKKSCHYTERKKCGPRSGQKTSKGPRRTRVSATSTTATATSTTTTSTTSSESKPISTRPQSSEQQQPQRNQLAGPVRHRIGMAGVPPSPSEAQSSNGYRGLILGPSPPRHASPPLLAGELSGETTCVDYTDSSEGGVPPPQQTLLRDVSGSSWWSLDEHQNTAAPGSILSDIRSPTSWAAHQHYDHGSTRFGFEYGRRVGGGQGEVGVLQHSNWAGNSDGVKGNDDIVAVSGSGSGVSGGSVGDDDSSGDDHEQDHDDDEGAQGEEEEDDDEGAHGEEEEDDDEVESLGQAEEEVAALLVGLGRTDAYLEDFRRSEESNFNLNLNLNCPPRSSVDHDHAHAHEPKACLIRSR